MSKSIKDLQLDYLVSKVNTELNNKVTKVVGKDLSTNDFSNEMKEKLINIAEGAEVNQNAFTAIKFNEIAILADDKNDIMHITSGDNITFDVDENGDSIVINTVIDDGLFDNSTNPVQNKVIKAKFDSVDIKINDTAKEIRDEIPEYTAISNEDIDSICGNSIVMASEVMF